MKTAIKLRIENLPALPACPLKGRGHKREPWPYRNIGLAAAAWGAVPQAHKCQVLNKVKGGFSKARAVSPEAHKALAHVVEALEAVLEKQHLFNLAKDAKQELRSCVSPAVQMADEMIAASALSQQAIEALISWASKGCPHPLPPDSQVRIAKKESGMSWSAIQRHATGLYLERSRSIAFGNHD